MSNMYRFCAVIARIKEGNSNFVLLLNRYIKKSQTEFKGNYEVTKCQINLCRNDLYRLLKKGMKNIVGMTQWVRETMHFRCVCISAAVR